MLNGAATILSDEESAELRWAYKHLEHPSLAARLSSRLASPIEEEIQSTGGLVNASAETLPLRPAATEQKPPCSIA